MSQPPPGRGRARGPSSPLHYRPPSPWAPSPPPLISGPRHSSALVSPGHRPSPLPFRPQSPAFRPVHSPSPSSHFSISPYCASPSPAPEYYYSSPYEGSYDYAGVPLEPPPPRPLVYEEDEERGPSTAEIIASQSQDGYVDEKLAEYQATIQLLQDEQERVQKKTFVNWINSYLSKRIPPLRIDDLTHDLRDGTKLLALLEVLSGERLPTERGKVLRRPHFLSNANTALRFLAGKRIKLVNINAADLVDGRPPVVLGLIWTIILYFQIEENSRALEYLGGSRCASAASVESGRHTPTHAQERWKQGAKKTLLQWVANALPKESNIQVTDFGPSWRDGIAFLAIIDAIKANLINLAEMKRASNRQRLERAFQVAESELGIARLLDAEDVDVEKPDERSIMTYVAQFLHKYPEPKTTGPDAVAAVQVEYETLRTWLMERLTVLQRMYDSRTLPREYREYATSEADRLSREPIYSKLEQLMHTQSLVAITPKSWRELSGMWGDLERLHRRWLWLLDSELPGHFRAVGEWLARAEYLLFFDEIPDSLDEKTAAIISEKIEEHGEFFADLPAVIDRFDSALRSPEASQITPERLQEMRERLDLVVRKAPQRKARLKYLEHKCCIVAFTNLTKAKLATWTDKYGHVDQVRALLEDYVNFVTRNKIFQEFDRAYVDIRQVADDYKKICDVDKAEAREIDSFLKEVAETWRRVSSDVRCAQSVLEETVAYWERWTPLVNEFTSWLDKAQTKLRVSEDERLSFFEDITVWKDRHRMLGECAGFLAATCADDIATEIKHKYVDLTERWERIFDEAKQYMHSGDILRHRRDYANGVAALSAWLRNAEFLLQQQPRAHTDDIKLYGEQLLKLQSELETNEELFKSVSKSFQSMIADLPRDEVDKNMATLKHEKEALVKVRAQIPVKLHMYHQLLVQHESLESGQKEINGWLDRAEEVLSCRDGSKTIIEQYDSHRSFFSRITYYKSMLESKNKVFQNIVKAVDSDKSADVTDTMQSMRQLNDRFAQVAQNAHSREIELQRLTRSWDKFAEDRTAVEEWLARADALLADRHVDSKQAIDYHKNFFTRVDDRLIHDLVQSGKDLLNYAPPEEHKNIVQIVESLQNHWREVLGRAPLHLMRLEFRLDETVFQQYIKDIEKEIIYEQQAYNQTDDADSILIRNEEYFRNQGKVLQVERCLQNLKKISSNYEQQVGGDSGLSETLERCEQLWEGTVRKVEHFRSQLQRIPAKWDAYKERFRHMTGWMDHVDQVMDSIVREVDSAEAFEREKTIFQTICREADLKREDMKWLVQNLDLLSSHCAENEAQEEQNKLEALIARYKNLIPTIEITMIKTETYTRCYTYRREVHEVVCILESVKEQSLQQPELQSLQHVEQLVHQQQAAVNRLDQQRPHVMSMLQRGKELMKDANTPAFVKDEVRQLEHGWSDTYSTTTDRLHRLRDTQKVWSNYEYQKDDLLSDLDRIESYVVHPGLELGASNIARELQETQIYSDHLNRAKLDKLPQLKSSYAELCALTSNQPKPIIEQDLKAIEQKMHAVQQNVDKKVENLDKYNIEWQKVENQLDQVRSWIQRESPAIIHQIQSQNITPEDRVKKSQELQQVINEKLEIVRKVANQGTKFAIEHRIQDNNKLKNEVAHLEKLMADLKRSSEHQSKVVEHDLMSWQRYQKGITELRPWIEEAETKLSNIPKPTTLEEAEHLQQQSKALLSDCDKQLMNLQILTNVSHQLSGKTSAPDEVDAIHSRWAVVHDQADQWCTKLDKLVSNWQMFNAETAKLQSWIENGEKLIKHRRVSIETPQIEKLDRELNQLKSFSNEVSQQQAKIISLTQASDVISHGVLPEGVTLIKTQIDDIKNRTNALADSARSKINELSDKIIAQQEFQTKLHTFENWMNDFQRKLETYDQVSSERVEPALQCMHVLLQEHAEKTPVFSDIYNEIKNITLSCSPDDTKALSDVYSNVAHNFQDLETHIQQNKVYLQKWAELLNWFEDSKQQLGHIQYQIEGPKLSSKDYDNLSEELSGILNKLPEKKSNVALLDGPNKLKINDNATGRILSPNNLIRDIEVKAASLLNQVSLQKNIVEKVGERWEKFNVQHKLVADTVQNVQHELSNISQKPVHLTKESIQDISEKLDTLESSLRDNQNVRKVLREEGLHLMREDQNNMGTIQNILSASENNWDQALNTVRDAKNKYILLSSTLQELNNFEIAFERELERAEQILVDCKQTPNDFVQTNQLLDKSKKAFEILKRSKGLLEQIELIKHNVLKQSTMLGGFDTTPLEETFLQNQTRWEKASDSAVKRIQDLDSQLIVWRQIDDVKNQVVRWLSEAGQNLANATENLDIRFGQSHLSKYNEELPIYLGLKNSLKSKCEQICNLNKNIPSGQISTIIDYLDNEFTALADIAENLQTAVSSLESKESTLKSRIKSTSDKISEIRDAIIKCDDMTGDNDKILERLRKCQNCKIELENIRDELENLVQDVTELNSNYPGYYESLIPKELNNLQKRFDSVLVHATKTESTLLSFLKKTFNEKFSVLNRIIKHLDDKLTWCIPDSSSDRYNLEVKMSALNEIENGIQECQTKYAELNDASEILKMVGEDSALQDANAQTTQIKKELENLINKHKEMKKQLADNIEHWVSYEKLSENMSQSLKEIENKVRFEAANLLNLNDVDNKIKEIQTLEENVNHLGNDIKSLIAVGDNIVALNPESRVQQYINHLVARHQSVSKFIAGHLQRIKELKKNKEKYNKSLDSFKTWLNESDQKYKELLTMSKHPSKPTENDLKQINQLTQNKDIGQQLLNNAIEAGESLYSDITPESREQVRKDLRDLRDCFEKSVDTLNNSIKDVETAINKRSSFDETFKKVTQWIADKENELGEFMLSSTLPEKKAVLHANKVLLQDVNLHQNILSQLQEKNLTLADEDAESSLAKAVEKYNNIGKELQARTQRSESHILDHEKYIQSFECCRDQIHDMVAQNTLVNFSGMAEKDDVDGTVRMLERIENDGKNIEHNLSELKHKLDTVLLSTHPHGHPILINEFEHIKNTWNQFSTQCRDQDKKLKESILQSNKDRKDIELLEEWLNQKENQVRDQSLKHNLEAKIAHLEKVKILQKEVISKSDDFTAVARKNQYSDTDSELLNKISKLVTRYHTLNNTINEIISKYESFVAEHQQFNIEYENMDKWLVTILNELKGLNEIVGDYAVLQEKQNKAKLILDTRNKKSITFEDLLALGEKLYTHTSPDGREVIRQQIRKVRSLWDSFGDNFQDTVNKLDQCLLQFSDFSLSQEQLTKWLKDVEKAMQKHTELKATLEEKKAQLQNHKIMHQEIMTHQTLVESVCDKAQQLVDQTHDASLNVYLQSIKQLFQNIVTKSQNLQDNLEDCVKKHEKLLHSIQQYKDWLSNQTDKITEINNVRGEKPEIARKLQTAIALRDIEKNGSKMLDDIRSSFGIVSKSTSEPGNTSIKSEIEALQTQLHNAVSTINDSEQKLKSALESWNKFETSIETIMDWLKVMEAKCRDQSLCANLNEKEVQCQNYSQLRNEISAKEREIDLFVDESHNLVLVSGVERIKPLVAQISSRYQQLHLLSKEIINHLAELVSDHKKYNQLFNEFNSWLRPLEEQVSLLCNKDDTTSSLENNGNKIQVLLLEREHGERKIEGVTAAGDKILPDTTAVGREHIRSEIRDLRERWENLNDNIIQQHKEYESQALQWSSYQDVLQQTLSWLDEKEKNISIEEKATLNSAPEIKTKLLKNKTLLQEIQSQKRAIEAVTDKAKNVQGTMTSEQPKSNELSATVQSIWDRYNAMVGRLVKLVAAQEESSDVYQHFGDQQKSLQEYLKNIWERLHTSSEMSGNKVALQAKLNKIQELIDSLPTANNRVKILSDHIDKHSPQLSARGKETLSREVTVLRVDLEKFTTTVHDVKRGLEGKIQQWSEFDATYARLQNWLNETEITLKNYAPKATLEEKLEQLNKYQGILSSLKKTEGELDKMTDEFNDLIENCNDTRISMNLQQITSRYQSVQSTAKEIVKKCEQAVADHNVYQEKYKQCSDWLLTAQNKFEDCEKTVAKTPDAIKAKRNSFNELLSQRRNATVLVNNTYELGEKLYPSTSPEGKELIEQQLQDLQQSVDVLYDNINKSERELDSEINKWVSFEEHLNNVKRWLDETENNLPKDIELKATLDEKRAQLNIYRHILQDALAHQQDIIDIEKRKESLPDSTEHVSKEIEMLKAKHQAVLGRAQEFVEQYEAIVNNHQQYSKSVMDLQEWVESTHNTVQLWGDVNLERVSLNSNCEKLKSLQLSMPEEKIRIERIRSLGEKVLPGTISSGQTNIQNQIDTSHQEWEGLLSFITKTIGTLENKIQQWNEYEQLKDQLLTWIRNTDTKIHAVDLKSTLDEKRDQFNEFKELQGEIRAKELEIDNITDKAQHLYTGVMGPRMSQVSDLGIRYQQVALKIKDLTNRWQQYVKTHQDFVNKVAECSQWFEDLRDKLDFCADLSTCSQDDLETKLVLIQNLLLSKDEGFVRVQSLVELAQNVLANTAPAGHAAINDALVNLQEQWSALLSKMVETKNLLDESVTNWAGFSEQVELIEKSNKWMENMITELEPYQGTISEKKSQLEKLKEVEEKARCDKIDVDTLKSKAAEMLNSGQKTPVISKAQNTLNKFDSLYEKIKKLLSEREAQYRDHRLYKEANDDLISWLSRAREKVPMLKSKPLSDKLAIENSVAPLESLINKQAQGELLQEHLQHTGEVALTSTSPDGQAIINNEIKALKESFESLFNEIKKQKNQLEDTVSQWRDYKDEYERISDWLQQIEIIIKNNKIALFGTAKEKENQVSEVQNILDQLKKGKGDIDKFNTSASSLLNSHLDSYIGNQLRHLNSRYQVLINMANDVFKKVQTNCIQHKEYDQNYEKTKTWIEKAWEITRTGNDTANNSSKEALQKRLEQIEDLLKRREEGQNLVHLTVNSGEKVLRNTRSDGKDKINTELKDLQADWDRLVKKMTTAKVHLETSLLQWADYSSSYSQLQQWINDREAKLQEVCEQKVAKSKKGQERLAGLATGLNLGERKATLRQTNNIVQDIVAFEPMIQSVTSKASELMQQAPATEITTKYETLSKQAKDLYEKQKEAVEKHQAFIDAGSEFVQWIRAAKERLGKCSEATGDKESLSSKISLLTILESELPEGLAKLQKALEQGELSCATAEEEDKEEIEEEVALMQEEYDTYVEQLSQTKSLVENGIVKWTEYEEKFKDALDWLAKTETLVQSYNKLQNSLEQKKVHLEEFQGHLQTLFDWQSELDKLNMRAQSLLETCSDTRISNGVTQITTKYNALLSLAKEVMKRLELYYQEHQQHNALYGECQDWLDRTREKLNQCSEMPNTLQEVNNKLNTVKLLRQSLEQGQNKLRYLLELKDKVTMNTEQSGAAKIQEDTDNLKQEFDKLMADIQDVRNKLTSRGTQFDDLHKIHRLLSEWLDDIDQKVKSDDSLLNDLSEKKAKLEKFKILQKDIAVHSDLVQKLQNKLEADTSLQCKEIDDTIQRFNAVKKSVEDTISILEEQVNVHNEFKISYDNFYDWVRNSKINIQQCSDSHGEKEEVLKKQKKIEEILSSMPHGEALLKKSIDLSNAVLGTTGLEGQDAITHEIKQLKIEWENLQHIGKDTKKILEKCLTAWTDFLETYNKFDEWIQSFSSKIKLAQSVEKITPEHLQTCRDLLAEALGKKHVLEELNDRCENLMELSACAWVRDKTVSLQSEYTTLLTKIQGLVSNGEKNLSDHTEFLKAKDELQKWLETAHGTVQDSIGVGDVETTKDKLKTVKLVSNRMTEGQHLLVVLQEAFKKALGNTPPEEQDALRKDVQVLQESWDKLKVDLNSITAQLNSAISKWEDFEENQNKINKWILDTEKTLDKIPPTKGELSEMKTLLEKYKHLEDAIDKKKSDVDHLKTEGEELSKWSKKPTVLDGVRTIETKCEALKTKCEARKADLDAEMRDYNAYHQSLQDTEKWLLQISFQLMAHNSLYIANREQTEEQLATHAVLLDDIQKYQTTLDDLKAEGQAQIERYSPTNATIKDTIGKQLKNVNDSHQSLLNTALQIEKRLREGLAKFKEYEDTLESILSNLDACEPELTELDVPIDNLPHGRELLEKARTLHNKLQAEKGRLSAAVAACSAAAASVSRPSSPADSAPLPIPARELHVRARLEDLIDEVQNHLSSIGEAVQGMEESMKQIVEIQEWVSIHNDLAKDWQANPSKLRPEAAKQDLAIMQEALVTLNEKRNKLATDIPLEGLEEDIDVSEALDTLEANIHDAIDREKGNQAIIDDFRLKCTEIHDWLDSTLKRACVADKGSGLAGPQKLSAIRELVVEVEQLGGQKIQSIKDVGSKIISIVSNLESQQVEEQIKSIERRYNDIAKRIQRKLQLLDITHKAVDAIVTEINNQDDWMQKQIDNITHPEPIGYESKSAKDSQKKVSALLKDVDSKKTVVDSLEKKLSSIQVELEPNEHNQLETQIADLSAKQKKLASLIKQDTERLGRAVEDRKKLETDLEKGKTWLKSKSAEIKKLGGQVPLEAIKIEKEINDYKNIQKDLIDFNNKILNDINRQGNIVLKDCSNDDKSKLQAILDELNKTYLASKVDIDDKIDDLIKVLLDRKDFESDFEKCQRWLNEADVSISPELRTSTLPLLEEQLAKFEKLREEADAIEKLLEKVTDKAKDIIPSLSDSNKLQLKEKVHVLSDKFIRIKATINDRKQSLTDQIKDYKNAAAKIAQVLEFLSDIQNKLKALNKPIGSKVEDVKSVLQAYETILDDLKANKIKLNELQGGNTHDLQDILTQQDDLMDTIDEQISKLKQLLLLREQFFGLIKEISEFVTKYTIVTTDIEKSNDSLENKIKRYDDIIVKIQECEALLASATDKGQQIAAEGTVTDRNYITELLQSSKQQLLVLRRTVEAHRQHHEKAAAEHKKLTVELSEILQWLHDNEAAVHSRPLLSCDVGSVDKKLAEHASLTKHIQNYLDKMTALTDSIKDEEGMPGSLTELISEANSLATTLPAELKEREQYLQDNKKHRKLYQDLIEKLNIWINEANVRLDMGKNGTDLDSIEGDLDEHRSFFGISEPEMRELVGKHMQDAVDKIWPSLSGPEQDHLSKDHQRHMQLLKNTLNSAKSRQAQLEQDLEMWKDFCQLLAKIRAILAKTSVDDEPAETPEQLRLLCEKLRHARSDLDSQQPLVEVVRERARALAGGADAASGERVEATARGLVDDWSAAAAALDERAAAAERRLQLWTQVQQLQRSLGAALVSLGDRARALDLLPASRRQAADTCRTLQELVSELRALEESREELVETGAAAAAALRGSGAAAAADDLEAGVRQLLVDFDKTRASLAEKLSNIEEAIARLDRTSELTECLRQEVETLTAQVGTLYVCGEEQSATERAVLDLATACADLVRRTGSFVQQARAEHGAGAPADVAQDLSALELAAEALSAAMEDKEREWKRARTTRSDYAADVDEVSAWVRGAELVARDRTLTPQPYRERLLVIRNEAPTVADRLERLTRSARAIIESSRDAAERQLVQSTVSTLSEQFSAVCAELDARMSAVEDACDAEARFLALLDKILGWVESQRAFLAQPLRLTDLQEAQHKQTEYANALKSCSHQTKNLSDMAKEIEAIEKVASPGELPSRLESAENSAVDVEKKLAQTSGLLQELFEEWERCEKKLKDAGHWLEATQRALESPQNAKKPLRDRLALREKIIADISTQKTKISYAVEKLNVHFGPDTIAAESSGPAVVATAAAELVAALDALGVDVATQTKQLEVALAQVDAYCADMASLRAQLLQAEQRLRHASAPNYSPRDPARAQAHQQECRDKIKSLQSKIRARSERVKLIVQRGGPDADPLTDT